MSKAAVALAKRADSRIRLLRGQKIILDSDLAELYGVPSKRLNQQVTRNVHRFPADFRFRLSRSEFENMAAGGICPTPSPSTVPSWPRLY